MNPITFVIIGKGVEAAFTAAMLVDTLGSEIAHCYVVAPNDTHNTGRAYETLSPDTQVLHERLGIDEADLLKRTNGTFTFGLKFNNWLRADQHFIQTYDKIGVNFDGVDFDNYFLRSKSKQYRYDHFSLSAMAAYQQRFTHPVTNQQSVLSTLNYGLTVDSALYAQYLKDIAVRKGVRYLDDTLTGVNLDPTGAISEAVLSHSTLIGDIYIDCSEENLSPLPTSDVVKHAPIANRKISVRRPHNNRTPNIQSISTDKSATLVSIALSHQRIDEYYLSSRHEDQAAQIPSLTHGKARNEDLNFGYATKPWEQNRLSIGCTACSFFPTLMSPIDLLYFDLQRFTALLPSQGEFTSASNEYNRQAITQYENVHNYSDGHLALNALTTSSLTSEPLLFDTCSEPLQQVFSLFQERGIVATKDSDIIPAHYWSAILMGSAIHPQYYNPLAEKMNTEKFQSLLERMQSVIAQAATRIPFHDDYLVRYTTQQK